MSAFVSCFVGEGQRDQNSRRSAPRNAPRKALAGGAVKCRLSHESRRRDKTVASCDYPIVAPANNRLDSAHSWHRVPTFGLPDAIRPFQDSHSIGNFMKRPTLNGRWSRLRPPPSSRQPENLTPLAPLAAADLPVRP
jgi:hypothetical protein